MKSVEEDVCSVGLSDQLNVPCCTLRRWAADSVFVRKAYVLGGTHVMSNSFYDKVSSLIAWLWLTTY